MNNNSKINIDIGIIGGTGIYDTEIFKIIDQIKISTPYGEPSDKITLCEYDGKKIGFIPRHGKGHRIPPHMINFRANIWALKELEVKIILAPSAVGSLKDEHAPGDIIIPDQYIDFTKNRKYTFYDGSMVCHISQSEPFCHDTRNTILNQLKNLNLKYHEKGTYVCIEGPRFSTKAESEYYRNVLKADIIGMTLVPECILAREMEICYASISTVTDYDVWKDTPVSSQEILETLSKNIEKTKALISKIIPNLSLDRNKCGCHSALRDALV